MFFPTSCTVSGIRPDEKTDSHDESWWSDHTVLFKVCR